MTGARGARGGRLIKPGSIASTASGSASVTVAIRLTQRICVGSTGRSRDAVHERERQHGDEDDQRLAEVRGEHEGDRLLHVVEHVPPFLHGGLDAREVVVGQHHVGRLARRRGPGLAHGDADVGLLERRRVVDAVAGHRHDLARALERAHEPQLVLGSDAREHRGLPRGAVERMVVERVELATRERCARQPESRGDRAGGRHVVAGDHLHVDARRPAGAHRSQRGLARRIDERGESEEPEAVGPTLLGQGEDAHALVGEALDGLQRPVDGRAPLEHDLGRALHVLDASCVLRGHVLALRVERNRRRAAAPARVQRPRRCRRARPPRAARARWGRCRRCTGRRRAAAPAHRPRARRRSSGSASGCRSCRCR